MEGCGRRLHGSSSSQSPPLPTHPIVTPVEKDITSHTYKYTYLQAHIHTHTYIYTYKHTYLQAYVHINIHTYKHTYIYTYILTSIRTYILMYECCYDCDDIMLVIMHLFDITSSISMYFEKSFFSILIKMIAKNAVNNNTNTKELIIDNQ